MSKKNNNNGGILLLAGIALGAAAGYYANTKKGRELRAQGAERVNQITKEVSETAKEKYQSAREIATDKYQSAREIANDKYADAKEGVESALEQGKTVANKYLNRTERKVEDLTEEAKDIVENTTNKYSNGRS